MHVQAGEWAELQRLRTKSPSDYPTAQSYYDDALVVDLLRKCKLPGDSGRCYDAAVDTFKLCEAQNASTNARLRRFINDAGPFSGRDMEVRDFIKKWRVNVYKVLGRLPLRLDPLFSQGATLSDKGTCTTIPDKMSSEPTVYRQSLTIAQHMVDKTILERTASQNWSIVRANRFFTVPKDTEKDRGCCVEASLNISAQLAVGKELRRRYNKRYEVNLADMQILHRKLAEASSRKGSALQLSTIDLSNASDTVARRLVELILPPDWFDLLNSLRATHTSVDGTEYYLEKFSSMGNGFTFELETIVFRTLCETVGSNCCYVYGDDIIVDTSVFDGVIAALRFFGFTPNEKKTFSEGPFRESCGGDFFDGQPVRAAFITELPDEPQHWVELANKLYRIDPTLSRFSAAWHYCLEQVPTDWRNFGPASLEGVCVFHVDNSDSRIKYAWRSLDQERHLIDGKLVKRDSPNRLPCYTVKQPVSRKRKLTKHWGHVPDVVLAAAVYGAGEHIAARDDIAGYKTAYIPKWGSAWLPSGDQNKPRSAG